MTSLVRWAHSHRIHHKIELASYFEASIIALEIEPVHVNTPHPCPRRSDTAELDDPVEFLFVSFAKYLNTTIWKISHPACDRELPCQVGNPATKENALNKSRDQNSCANVQTRALIIF